MEKSNKRGKIPQSDWPLIMTRYEAGETLSSIARTYDCSPPAISYVVSRSRARPAATAAAPSAPPVGSTQLVKAAQAEPATGSGAPPGNGSAASDEPTPTPPPNQRANGEASHPPAEPTASLVFRSDGNGNGERPVDPPGAGPHGLRPAPPTAPPPNGDHRRTLHLSLGGPTPGNGHAQAAEPREDLTQRVHDPVPAAGFAEARPPAYPDPVRRPDPDGVAPRESAGSFIDQELRARVEQDIAAFLAAFDGALALDTQESRTALREATDRLLRAGARTRIELERLEARLPLPARDNGARAQPAWRPR